MTPASVIQRAREAGEAWALEDKAEREKAAERAKAEALSTAAALARDALELGPDDTLELEWDGEEVTVTVDDLGLAYKPGGRALILPSRCPAGHLVDMPIRTLVDLYLVMEGAATADRCHVCHPEPHENTWAVSVVQAGDSRALLEALDSFPPHDVMVVPAGEYLHVIGGFDA